MQNTPPHAHRVHPQTKQVSTLAVIDSTYWGALLALHGHPAADSWRSLSAKRDKSWESLHSRAPTDISAARGQAGDGVTHPLSWAALVSLQEERKRKFLHDNLLKRLTHSVCVYAHPHGLIHTETTHLSAAPYSIKLIKEEQWQHSARKKTKLLK